MAKKRPAHTTPEKQPIPKPPTRRTWVYAGTAFAFAFVLYANTLRNDFVWDDRVLIVENPEITELNGDRLGTIFTEHFWRRTERSGGLHRPLVTLSYYLDYRLYGLNPTGFHLTNILLNAVTCALVCVLFGLILQGAAVGFTAALVFAAMPLHTENVAWIAGRTDLMATMFMVGSLVLFVVGRKRRVFWWIGLSVVAFAAALLSKEFAAVLPPLVALVGVTLPGKATRWRPFAAERRADWLWFPLLYAGVLGLYMLWRTTGLGIGVQVYAPQAEGANVVPFALATLAGYCAKLLFPFRLNAEYETAVPDGFFDASVWAGVAFTVAIAAAWWRWRRTPTAHLALGFFVLPLLPVLNIVPITESAAERFLYLPSIGFSMIVAMVVLRLRSSSSRSLSTTAMVVFAALIAAYTARTMTRNSDWRNETTLFTRTIGRGGDQARAHLNLAGVYYRDGNFARAIDEYQKVLELDPAYAGAWSGLAGCYKGQGRIDEAIETIRRAIEIEPANYGYYNSLGSLYTEAERFREAIVAFGRALELKPDNTMAHFNLALAHYVEGHYDEARHLFETLDFKDSEYVHAYYFLAVISYHEGERLEGREYARRFLSLHPGEDERTAHLRSLMSGKSE